MPLLLKYVIWCEYDKNVCCLQCALAMFAHSGVVTSHTDPEQRIGFFECLRGSEGIYVIAECVQNLRKRI